MSFQNQEGEEEFCWTTSWGVSTRLVGALIMTHSDDDGLVLPPRLAPKHVVILPICRSDEDRTTVLPYCESLKKERANQTFSDGHVEVMIDDRDLRGGEKNWYHIKRGVPLRVEVGPKDIAKNGVFVGRRDSGEKASFSRDEFVANIGKTLDEIQENLFARAKKLRDDNSRVIDNIDDFKAYFTAKNSQKPEIHGGFVSCFFVEDPSVQQLLKKLKVTIRCVSLADRQDEGTCIFTGKPTNRRGVFAKAY
jgi:prolyl-tRNA synthetase